MDEILTRKYLYPDLPGLIDKGKPIAIATVTETSGSSPQIPGSSAIIGEHGLISGTVGGGMTEYQLTKEALVALKERKSAFFRYDLDEDISDPDAVICGGGMSILIDANPGAHKTVFNELSKSYKDRIPGVLITSIKTSLTGVLELSRYWVSKDNVKGIPAVFSENTRHQLKQMLEDSKAGDFRFIHDSSLQDKGSHRIILESIIPLPRLIIAGAGHVGKALSHLGKLLDFEVIVWDDREEYANELNLPDASRVFSGNLNASLAKLNADKDTFIVIVTRGHKNDSDVLRLFIQSEAGYIGMIGSKKKVAQVRNQFIDKGWATPEEWARVHSPIGLKIHSKTVQEIAFSIAAELIKVRYEINQGNE